MTQFSEDQAADDPVSACDDTIRPIFPVRFALTEDKLFELSRNGGTVRTPNLLRNHPDHDLRRIRQGYVYIWTESEWLIFRYSGGGANDDNSSMDRRDTVNSGTTNYRFQKYEWDDGVESEWRITDPRSYPYAFVHRDVSKIHIAYSEERWPGHLFLMAEIDADTRAKLMTEVRLVPENDPHAAPMSELDQHVAEFNNSYGQDPYGNAIRFTALQPEDASRVVICSNSRNHGRIVVVKDHLGELLDVSALHLWKSHSLKTFSAEYQYPLMIGKGIANLEEFVGDGSRRWNDPVTDDYRSIYDQMIREQEALNREIGLLVRAFYAIATRDGPGTLLAEAQIAMKNLNRVGSEAEMRRVDYVFFLLARTFLTLGTSVAGSASLSALLAGLSTGKTAELGSLMSKSISASGAASSALLQKYRTHFHLLLEVTAKELAINWVTRPSGLIARQTVERILGVTQRTVTVPAATLGDALRMNFNQLGFVGVQPRDISVQGLTAQFQIGAGTRPTTLVGVPFYDVSLTGTLSSSGQRAISTYRNIETGMNGGTFVLAAFSAFQTLNNWQSRPRTTRIGGFFHDPAVQISGALLDLAAAAHGMVNALNSGGFATRVSAQLFSQMFASGSVSRLFTGGSAAVRNTSAAGGMAGRLIAFTTLANVAGAVGVVIAAGQSYEGFMSGDLAAGYGNAMVAVGGIVLLLGSASIIGAVPAAIIGGLLIVVGATISFFQDNDAEAWARRSFWGKSRTYWDTARANVPELIEIAKTIYNENDRIYNFYLRELEDYANLTWSIQIENPTEGDMMFDIIFPGLTDAGEMARMRVNVVSSDPIGLGPIPLGTVSLDVAVLERTYLGSSSMRVRIAPPTPEARANGYLARIYAYFPKSSGGEFEAHIRPRWVNV